jgi:iron complex outermembrane receptor protein
VSLLVNHTYYTAQIPSSIGRTDFEEDPSQAAFTWQQSRGFESDDQTLTGLSVKHEFTDDFKTTTSIFYTYSDHYEPRPFNILDEFTNGFGLRTVFNKSFDFLNRKAEWTFGGELFKDEYHWKTIENLYQENNGNGSLEGMLLSYNEEFRQQLNLFSSVTLPILEDVTMQFGVNYNKTNYDFQDEFNSGETNKSISRSFDAIVAPNLNVLYQFTKTQNVFANVSYGFNYPSLEEALTPEGLINAEISPEKGFNYEIGSESFFFQRKLHILASVYVLDIKDLLVAQRIDDDQFIGRNAGRTLHKGLELSSDYKFKLGEDFIISPYVNATFNWHRFKDFISDNTDFSGNKLTGVPAMTIASGIGFQYHKIALFTNQLYVGEMPINDANSLYSDAYTILNLKLTYDTQLFKTLDFRLNFGINNVLDSQYASAILINATGFNNSEPRYYYPGNPRNYYGGISFRYHL